ncbi:RING-H2 finger protein ATL22-like isoform X2 [Andrographis paniculata]|uniref:RING-H2 finger protein ATL22-like isoform X2 n=1 Tax=Andrographis paniculata TaxID=175694 RepID=UPI0021E73117|nr:RING-H2 finger protein ATL22-like isoform X2 [Andrographis paniculata]
MAMAMAIFLSTLSITILLLTHTSHASTLCPALRLPGAGAGNYDILCKDNVTMIHFPGYGHLAVKSIDYAAATLDLIDPRGCVHEVFLNLDLSATPFRYYYILKDHVYVKCSVILDPPLLEVPCMSRFEHHVYILESSPHNLPASCSVVRSVAIPFPYSPYLSSHGSFGLRLTWRRPPRWWIVGEAEAAALILILILMFYVGIYEIFYKKTRRQHVKNFDAGNLLEE